MNGTVTTCSCSTEMAPIYNGTVVGCPHCDRNVCRVAQRGGPACEQCRTVNQVRR